MKKITIITILGLLIIPTITHASWWNPFSWFEDRLVSKNTETETDIFKKRIGKFEEKSNTSIITPVITKFYVKYNNTRLRECASTTCNIKNYYPENHEITTTGIQSETLNDLGEWLAVTQPDGSMGYLHKSVLSEKPLEINKVTQLKTGLGPETTSTSRKDRKLSDLNSYIDVLISNYEELVNYVTEMKKSTEFYGGNFERAKALAIRARGGGTLPSHLQQASDLLIEAYIDPAIKNNDNFRNSFTYYIDTENSLIAKLQKEKEDNVRSVLVSKEEYLSHYNKLKKIYGDNVDQHKAAFADSFSKFLTKTENHQTEISAAITKMTRALDAYYLPQINAYKNDSHNNSMSAYQPIIYPQIQIPKTINCTMGPMSGARGYYTVSCF